MASALVLLDIQRGILASSAISFHDPAVPAAMLDKARALLEGARSAGLAVIHVGVARLHQRGNFDAPRTQTARVSGKAPRDVLPLAPDSPDTGFLLVPTAGEEVIHKLGVSAFEGTRLDQSLRNLSIDEVVLAGAFTHMVVESSARQGFDLGYRMIIVHDACCAPAPAPHANSLATGIPNFARLMDCDTVVARLRTGEPLAP